jgi:hypothetical protein
MCKTMLVLLVTITLLASGPFAVAQLPGSANSERSGGPLRDMNKGPGFSLEGPVQGPFIPGNPPPGAPPPNIPFRDNHFSDPSAWSVPKFEVPRSDYGVSGGSSWLRWVLMVVGGAAAAAGGGAASRGSRSKDP